jgi:hypothetical protein
MAANSSPDPEQGLFSRLQPQPEDLARVGTTKIVEVSPPQIFQELRQDLDKYQPQVKILSPKAEAMLTDNTVSVQFQVEDLPIFKDQTLGLGPHLHVFLDNQLYQAVYDVTQPLKLEGLEPGTHTLRVFASRPWHESYKNSHAYAQVTFHVFTETVTENQIRDLPLLTYSRPQGVYGAEPVMLDFYLSHLSESAASQKSHPWQVRVTVNGDRFLIYEWQPLYLQGFKPGKNWVQLELLDQQGDLIPNAYNPTLRVIDLQPDGQDPLAQMVRGELVIAKARGIVDPNYTPEVEVVPELEPTAAETNQPAMEILDPEVDLLTSGSGGVDSDTIPSADLDQLLAPPLEDTQALAN